MAMKPDLSRRDFLGRAGLGLTAATLVVAGCAPREIVKEVPIEVTREVPKEVTKEVLKELEKEIPPSPWQYTSLEEEAVRKLGHASFYEGDCCYGAFAAIVDSLKELVGFPYTQMPTRMMEFGAGGMAGWGTTCGALIGASAAINLVTDKATAKKIVSDLLAWYSQTPFPSEKSNEYASAHTFLVAEYKSDKVFPQSVSNSPLCHVSVTEWCKESGFASGSIEREERCARLTGDVASHVVGLLNANLAGSFAPVFKISEESQGCATCHSKGENYKMGQFTQGLMECTSCHEPHN